MNYNINPNDAIPYEIRFEDDELLVVAKPSGVVTQPGKKHPHDSLLNGLFTAFGKQLQNLGADRNWGLLHRLDKDTSGLVIVALRNRSYDYLLDEFMQRRIKKNYWAIVAGTPRPGQGVIQKPIAEIVGSRKKAVIRRDGRPSITAYRVLHSAGGVSLVEAMPKTGRLHQIRVHMAAMGHPLLGESLYAGKIRTPQVRRLCLHAGRLSFRHPATGHRLEVASPWPKDLNKTLKRFDLPTPEI